MSIRYLLSILAIAAMVTPITQRPPRRWPTAARCSPTRSTPCRWARVMPKGWLLEQLRLQAQGLSGHLDEFWPDLGPQSAWLGGSGEGWERGPYFLDGLVPLAYLTQGCDADRQGEEVDGLGAGTPAARWRHRSREEPGLVAELRDAQGADAVPGSVGRRARDSADGEIFRLPGAPHGRAPAQGVGHLPLARRSAERALALQPQRRPRAARPGAQAAHAGARLGGAVRRTSRPKRRWRAPERISPRTA